MHQSPELAEHWPPLLAFTALALDWSLHMPVSRFVLRRCNIAHSQYLHQISSTCAHLRPEGKITGLRAGEGRQDESSCCFGNVGVARHWTRREGIRELIAIVSALMSMRTRKRYRQGRRGEE
jgi:hypothetical protein